MLFRFVRSCLVAGPRKISPSLLDSHYTTAKSCEPLQVPSLLRMVCCKNKLLARGQLALAAAGAVVWHCTGQLRHLRHRADERLCQPQSGIWQGSAAVLDKFHEARRAVIGRARWQYYFDYSFLGRGRFQIGLDSRSGSFCVTGDHLPPGIS